MPGVPADEALGFFTRRFEALELEVSLLERRIATGAVSPDDAVGSIKKLRRAIAEAHAVGDLDGLQARLDALSPVIAEQRAARTGRTGPAAGGDPGREGEVRRRGRAARRRERLAGRGEPLPRAAGRVEGAAPARPGHRRRAVAPILQRADDLHPAAQGPVRPAERAARGRPSRSRSSWSPRRRGWRTRPTGARQPVPTVI